MLADCRRIKARDFRKVQGCLLLNLRFWFCEMEGTKRGLM